MGRAALLALLAAGCGDNDLATFELQLHGQAALFGYRGLGGSWTAPAPTTIAPGRVVYTLPVMSQYEVAVVCELPDGGIVGEQLVATADDTPADYWPRFGCLPSFKELPPVPVHGEMAQSGIVVVQTDQRTGTGSWSYAVTGLLGANDVVAFTADSARALVRHDEMLTSTAGNTEPPIDLAVEGASTIPITIAAAGVDPAEHVITSLSVETKNHTQYSIAAVAPTIYAIPPSQLDPADRQEVSLATDDLVDSREAIIPIGADPVPSSVTLLPKLHDVHYGDTIPGASWPPLAFDYTDLVVGYRDSHASVSITATRRWLDARDATSLAIDTVVPGWRADWALDVTAAQARLTVEDRATPVVNTTIDFTPTIPRWRPAR